MKKDLEKLKKSLINNYSEIQEKSKRLSAVLVPIIKNDDKLLLLFEKRVKRPMRHSGEISFPGGKIEDNETPLETALRETYEEVGIPPEQVEILGYLKPTKTKSSGFLIIPVVGYIKEYPKIKINPSEVEDVLIVSIEELERNRRTTILGPYFKIDNNVIWGATARIVEDFLKILKKQVKRD